MAVFALSCIGKEDAVVYSAKKIMYSMRTIKDWIKINEEGCREIIGAAEGMEEDKESWRSFFVWLKERGLCGMHLIIGVSGGTCENIKIRGLNSTNALKKMVEEKQRAGTLNFAGTVRYEKCSCCYAKR